MKKIGIFLRVDSMKKASEQELWYENIRYRFYPGLQVTFDKKTVNIRFAYKKNNGFSIADYNNPDEKKQEICKLSTNYHETSTSIILSTFSLAVPSRKIWRRPLWSANLRA